MVFGTAIRYLAKKPKPPMKPIELKTPPEQTQTISRVIFDIVKEHGPLTIAQTWDHIKEVGMRGLKSKRHMKIVLRWDERETEAQADVQPCATMWDHTSSFFTQLGSQNPTPSRIRLEDLILQLVRGLCVVGLDISHFRTSSLAFHVIV